MQASEVGDTLRVAELNEQVQPLIESYFNSEIEFIKSHSGDYLGHYLLNLTKEELDLETVKETANNFITELVYSKQMNEYIEQNQPVETE